jgi:transposase
MILRLHIADMGRPHRLKLHVSDEQLAELNDMVKKSRSDRNLAFRSRIILGCNAGLTSLLVAKTLRTTHATVGFWRKRFILGGVESLRDEPRPGAPRRLGDDKIEQLIKETLESQPKGATHWSTRSMAQKMGFSQSTVSRIWRAFGLKPHRSETFQLSTDPYFIEKVRDVVGLYMSPPANALVLSVDEKSQIQALNRTQPLLPMRPGQAERKTYEYKRNGVTSLFAALDTATGNVMGKCFRRHRSIEFKHFLDYIDSQIPENQEVHLILDNYATHKTPLIKQWLLNHPKYHLHFTPTHSSWLNQVERWFGLLSEKQIKRGSHSSVKQLEMAIQAFIDEHNDNPRPFAWTKTADQILSKVKRFAKKTLDIHTDSIMKEINDSGD